MAIFNIKIKNLLIIFFIVTGLANCASNSKLIPSLKNINQNGDFTIEGKFKIKINKIQENGYFILKKQKNTMHMGLKL